MTAGGLTVLAHLFDWRDFLSDYRPMNYLACCLAVACIKLVVNKPQCLTFPRKIYKLSLTRFLEVSSQGGSSETLS